MNILDLMLLGLLVLGAVGGYRLGFITRAVSWVGMAAGVVVAAVLVPPLLRAFDDPNDAQVVFVYAGLLLAGAFLGQVVGLVIGGHLHLALPNHVSRRVDQTAGAGLGALGVLVAVWMITPMLVEIQGDVSRLARSSSITAAVDRIFPDLPGPLADLSRLVGGDFPRVFADSRPAPRLGPPPPESGLTEAQAAAIEASVGRVEGRGGNRIQQGSAFSIGGGLWVTNAHVVACVQEPRILTVDGAEADGRLVGFDSDRDLALLHTPDLDRPALGRAEGAVGERGAVFGFPGGGGLELSPFEIGRKVIAEGRDLYNTHNTERDVFFLAVEMRSGDSGAAVVRADGQVVAVAFATAPDRPHVGYALTQAELEEFLGATDPATVADPGPCLR